MEILSIISVAIAVGSALGALVVTAIAGTKNSRIAVLVASNNDYKERVNQLEEEREANNALMAQLRVEVDELKKQKALPLEKLTKLVVEQHSQNMTKLDAVAAAMSDVARELSKANQK